MGIITGKARLIWLMGLQSCRHPQLQQLQQQNHFMAIYCDSFCAVMCAIATACGERFFSACDM